MNKSRTILSIKKLIVFTYCLFILGLTSAQAQINYKDSAQFRVWMDSLFNPTLGTKELGNLLEVTAPFLKNFPESEQSARYYYKEWDYLDTKDNIPASEISLQKAIDIGKNHNYYIYTRARIARGFNNNRKEQYHLSMKQFLDIFKELKYKKLTRSDSSNVLLVYNGISICYNRLLERDSAIKYSLASRPFIQSPNDSLRYYTRLTIAYLNDIDNNLEQAPENIIDSAIDIARRYNFKDGLYMILMQSAANYSKKGQYDKALAITQELSSIADTLESDLHINMVPLIKADAYLGLKNYKECLNQIAKCIHYFSSATFDPSLFTTIMRMKAESFAGLKQYDSAYYYSLKHLQLKDSANARIKNNFAYEVRAIYDLDEKEKVIEIEQAKIASERELRKWLIGALAFMFLLMAYAAYSYIKAKKLNKLLQDKNKQIEKQSAKLLENNKLKDKLFTIIGHDLRSPLNAYQGLADSIAYLIKNKRYDEVGLLANQIDSTGKKINNMLSNLLQWSVSNQVNLSYTTEPIDASSVINQVLDIYKSIATAKDINIKAEIENPLEIISNTNYLTVIIRNLVDNAIKNSPANEQVMINAFKKDNSFYFKISNHCNASCENTIPVLKEFFDNKENTQLGKKGIGLGMAIVHQFINKMGAEINLSLKYNYVTFEIKLPQNIYPN